MRSIDPLQSRLEAEATRAGCSIVKPPVITGISLVEHQFSFLATCGGANYAIDIYDAVTELEVLGTFAKMCDTKTSAHVLCAGGKRTEEAESLAKEYGMRILGPENLKSFFGSLSEDRSGR